MKKKIWGIGSDGPDDDHPRLNTLTRNTQPANSDFDSLTQVHILDETTDNLNNCGCATSSTVKNCISSSERDVLSLKFQHTDCVSALKDRCNCGNNQCQHQLWQSSATLLSI